MQYPGAGHRVPGILRRVLPGAAFVLAAPAYAQPAPSDQLDRPGITRPVLPAPGLPAPVPLVLPGIAPPQAERDPLSAQARVFVREIRVLGASALSLPELAALTGAYENREVGSEELQELRDKLTLAYVMRGYVNSGAVLPDQEVRAGVIEYRIVEGRLNRVEIAGNPHLNSDYISGRVLLESGPPLNLNALQRRLQLLQQSGLLERINAELVPGLAPGESTLRMQVEEARPYQLVFAAGNNRSPSIGGNRGELAFSHRNLSGNGDALVMKLGAIARTGRQDLSLDYGLPLNRHDTALLLHTTHSEAVVVETPFDALDIRNRARSKSIGIGQPLLQTPDQSLGLTLTRDFRQSQAYLLGLPFSFSAGIPDGYSAESAWRFSQDWLRRGSDEVIALRSTFSYGKTNALDKIGDGGPDRSFHSWLAQFQWVRRFAGNGSQMVFRADLQQTRQALLSLDKFALGGMGSVRGFRESQFLRDKGYVASLEYRYPILRSEAGEGVLQLAPFIDHGNAWNADLTLAQPRSISSIGLGLLWSPSRQLQAQLYLAKGSRSVPQATRDWQDRGVHFQMSYQFF